MQHLQWRRICTRCLCGPVICLTTSVTLLFIHSVAFAQQLPQTKLYATSPTGGKVGTTFELKVTNGADMESLSRLVFNHPGITAVPKTQAANGKPTPVANTFMVTIAPNVPVGLYEVRAVGLYGMSNPRTFMVGQHAESAEEEANNNAETANETNLNTTINGTISGAADIDCFKFTGNKGQRVVFDLHAARIDSQLRAAMEVFGPSGRRLKFSRKVIRQDPHAVLILPESGEYQVKIYDFTYRGGPDYFYRFSIHTTPYIEYVLPLAGQPGTTGTFTLYGHNLPGGQSAGTSLNGVPLQKMTVSIPVPQKISQLEAAYTLYPYESTIDGFEYVFRGSNGHSNPVFIHFAQSPVAIEKEPNNSPETAQPVKIPVDFSGQFQQNGDIDFVTFTAKANETYYIDVIGHRGGSSADPYLTLDRITKDDKGVEKVQRIATQDDTAAPRLRRNTFNPFLIGSDDPVYRFKVPADGTYRVSIRDRYFESRGGPRLYYRLAIRKANPDFRLVVLPETPPRANNQPTTTGSIALRKGENIGVRVTIFRRDGFQGAVDIRAEGLPPGVICKGASIGPGVSETTLIFSTTENAADWSGLIKVVGQAKINDPEKVQAVATAEAAVKSADAALPKLRQNNQKTMDALKKAQSILEQAKAALAKKPKDKNLAKKVAAAQAAVTKATQAANQAKSALAAGEKRAADARSAVKKAEAERVKSIRTVQHEARPGTIVWSGSNQVASVSRIAHSLGLSVISEKAPFQVTTDVFRVEANQGRQILIPIKLVKRNGFDNTVNMTFQGMPQNTNITLQNKNIPKGKDSELLQILVKPNAKVGVYTLYLKTQGQVSYRRNLDRLKRAEDQQKIAAKNATDAAAKLKTATQVSTAAAKKAATDAARAKTTATALATAQKNATAAAALVKTRAAAKVKADQALAKAQAAVKAAQAKALAAKKALEKDPKNKALANAKVAADKALAVAIAAEKNAATAKTNADKALADAQKANLAATTALQAAEKANATAQATAKASKLASDKAAAATKAASDASKAATAAKSAADRELAAAKKAAASKTITIFPPSTPIVLVIKEGAATLTATVPNGGALKIGKKIDVKVTLKRINGFTGPVKLSLPLPPNVTGLTAPEVTIPADKTSGTLSISAAGNATTGTLANMVVRATMDFNGKAAVDAPITLKVSK